MESLKDLQLRYESLKGLGLKLNIERGQPGDDNFDLSNALLGIVTEKDIKTKSGFDIRNYPGGVLGLPEARELFSGNLRRESGRNDGRQQCQPANPLPGSDVGAPARSGRKPRALVQNRQAEDDRHRARL